MFTLTNIYDYTYSPMYIVYISAHCYGKVNRHMPKFSIPIKKLQLYRIPFLFSLLLYPLPGTYTPGSYKLLCRSDCCVGVFFLVRVLFAL